MVLNEPSTYLQVLGSLIKNPILFLDVGNDLEPKDFEGELPKLIYSAINNLVNNGAVKLTAFDIDNYLRTQEIIGAKYEKLNGLTYIEEAINFCSEENFKLYYDRLKKLSLLRELKKKGYDISYYYKESLSGSREEIEYNERFDATSVQEILDTIESKFSEIRHNFTSGLSQSQEIQVGIEELVESFKIAPEMGMNLNGDITTTAVRGMRLGKYYIRSGFSGTGKSRQSFFDAAYVAFPERWCHETGMFMIEDRNPEKTLVITTEMDMSEVQTIILAYLSGVDEERILYGNYYDGEYDRVKYAIEITKKYPQTLFIEEIQDPNLNNVRAAIKRHATTNKISYCFYDYIFTSPSLLSQFQRSGVREEVALSLLSNQLKELAKEYHIFIMTSTQTNSDGMRADGPKNQLALRASKAIAEKCDVGMIISPVMREDIERFIQSAPDGGTPLIDIFGKPTHVIDIYKNRRGKYKDIRIWIQLNLGTGERRDLFMTNKEYQIINIPELIVNRPSRKYFTPDEQSYEQKTQIKSELTLRLEQVIDSPRVPPGYEQRTKLSTDNEWSDLV